MKEKEYSATETTHNGRTSRNQGPSERELTREWCVSSIRMRTREFHEQQQSGPGEKMGKMIWDLIMGKLLRIRGKSQRIFRNRSPTWEA